MIPEPNVGSTGQDTLDLANKLTAVCSEAVSQPDREASSDLSNPAKFAAASKLRKACQAISKPRIRDITLEDPEVRDALIAFLEHPITADQWRVVWDGNNADASGTATEAMSGGLGVIQAAVINGLTAFLIDRAQQELLDYMQARLRSTCDQTVSSCRVSDYMPSVCKAFKTTEGEQGISMFSLGRTLRAAAIADLQSLPERALFQLQSLVPPTQDKSAYIVARLIYAVGRSIYDGRDPFETIAGLETSTKDTFGCNADNDSSCDSVLLPIQKLGKYTRIVLPIINHIRSKDKDRDRNFDRYHLVASVLVLWKSASSEASELTRKFNEYAELVSDIFTTAKELQAAIDLVNRDLAKDDSGRAQRLADHWKRIVSLETRLMLAHIQVQKNQEHIRRASRIIERVIAGDYSTALVDVFALMAALGIENHSLATLTALGTELSGATSSDEVVTILKTAAAPPGGWRLKYRKQMVSITGFVGGGYYFNRIQPGTGLPGQINESLGFEHSLYPSGILGIQYSYPLKYIHLGALLSLIDVGALARKKLGDAEKVSTMEMGETINATVREENNVGFAQVFSPGVYLTVGLCKSMLTLGLGVSAVPELHSIDVVTTRMTGMTEMQETTTVEGNGIRVGGFLAVDVTILPF